MLSVRTSAATLLFAGALVALSRASCLAQTVAKGGDAARGEAILADKGNCLSCHRVADHGSYMAPNLSAIGSDTTATVLRKAILDPSPEVQSQNQLFRAVTRRGTTYTGRLLNQDQYSIQMLDSQNKLVALERKDLSEAGFVATPPMPSYRGKLTASEQTDLIAYLLTLRGVVKQ